VQWYQFLYHAGRVQPRPQIAEGDYFEPLLPRRRLLGRGCFGTRRLSLHEELFALPVAAYPRA
jgi:hypothetical protein